MVFLCIQDYIRTDPSGRDPDTPIYMVKQGYENVMFVGYFGVWDRELWSVSKSTGNTE